MRLKLSQLRRIIRETVEAEMMGAAPAMDVMSDPDVQELLDTAKMVDQARGGMSTGGWSRSRQAEDVENLRRDMIPIITRIREKGIRSADLAPLSDMSREFKPNASTPPWLAMLDWDDQAFSRWTNQVSQPFSKLSL